MKLVTFENPDEAGKLRLGALGRGETAVVDQRAADAALGGTDGRRFSSMLAMIEAGEPALDAARGIVERAERCGGPFVREADAVRLATPIPAPPQIRDCLCFEEHLVRAYAVARRLRAAQEPDPEAALKAFEEKGLFRVPEVWYRQPIYYKANRFSVIGPGEDVVWPGYAEILDYELEFGCFIGRSGKDIPRGEASRHIFGYSIFNDLSARDAQVVEMPGQLGPAKGKDFDTGNVIGPCIVTADEIDPYDLTMVVRVNGEERGRGHTSSMHWRFEDVIAHVSRSETLHAGEFLGSGTVGGGCGLKIERFLAPGDVVELEVERIGILGNRIVKEGS